MSDGDLIYQVGICCWGSVPEMLGFDKPQPQAKTLGLGVWVLLTWVLTAEPNAAIESWE